LKSDNPQVIIDRMATSKTAGVVNSEEVLLGLLEADPEFAAEWHRLAPARAVSFALIHYRHDRGLTQRDLAKQLGVSQPRVADLESGEKSPTIETLAAISAATGIEFALSTSRAGKQSTFLAMPMSADYSAQGEPAGAMVSAIARLPDQRLSD
jgi:transcriptional regulator with XRE-family HTH domain